MVECGEQTKKQQNMCGIGGNLPEVEKTLWRPSSYCFTLRKSQNPGMETQTTHHRVYHPSKSWTFRLKFKSDHSRCVLLSFALVKSMGVLMFNDLFECWNLQLLKFTFGLGDLKIFKLNLHDRGCIEQSQCTNILINIPTIQEMNCTQKCNNSFWRPKVEVWASM